MQSLIEMNKGIMQLITRIQDYVYDYNQGLTALETVSCRDLPGLRSSSDMPGLDGTYEVLLLQQQGVLHILDRLKLCSHRSEYTPTKPILDIRRVLGHLEKGFLKLADLTLRKELKSVVEALSSPHNDLFTIDSLNILIGLGNQQSQQVNSVLSEIKTIETLVQLCESTSSREVQLLSLRSISSVSCTIECIRNLESAGGIGMISRLLVSDPSLEVRVEAAGVLAQITSPWISDNHRVSGLDDHVSRLVPQLSNLARLQCGEDSFLLVSAALANLTFMEPTCLENLLQCSTSKILMSRVESTPFISLFARDQVVTVLANLAGVEPGRKRILRDGGIEFLVSQLNVNVDTADTQAELEAVERMLKKSAIALCRLCLGEAECRLLEQVGGVERAVQLSQEPASRNYSDSVLVACLALVRRVSSNLNLEIEQSLIQDSLVQSFRELSSKHESYV